MFQSSLFQIDNRCSLTVEGGGLALRSPYIPKLVEAIKALPYAERRWDNARRLWIIDAKHAQQLVQWIEIYANEQVPLPSLQNQSNQHSLRLLEVRYIGACKPREDGNSVAFGLVGSDWSVIFPESVLRAWFEGGFDLQEQPSSGQTLYQVLGVKKDVSSDEIKTAYRRMVKQWHPDICREPNAHEIFLRIQDAYKILIDPNSRARYNAGLYLQAKIDNREKNALKQSVYRTPLRCGLILVEGTEKLGRLVVDRIREWQDIVRNGKTLVVSWQVGAKEPTEIWS